MLGIPINDTYTLPPSTDPRVIKWAMDDPYIMWAIQFVMSGDTPSDILGTIDPDMDELIRKMSLKGIMSTAAGVILIKTLKNNYRVHSAINSRYALLENTARLEGGAIEAEMQPVLSVLQRASTSMSRRVAVMTTALVAHSTRFGIAAHDIITGRASQRYASSMERAEAHELEMILRDVAEVSPDDFAFIQREALRRRAEHNLSSDPFFASSEDAGIVTREEDEILRRIGERNQLEMAVANRRVLPRPSLASRLRSFRMSSRSFSDIAMSQIELQELSADIATLGRPESYTPLTDDALESLMSQYNVLEEMTTPTPTPNSVTNVVEDTRPLYQPSPQYQRALRVHAEEEAELLEFASDADREILEDLYGTDEPIFSRDNVEYRTRSQVTRQRGVLYENSEAFMRRNGSVYRQLADGSVLYERLHEETFFENLLRRSRALRDNFRMSVSRRTELLKAAAGKKASEIFAMMRDVRGGSMAALRTQINALRLFTRNFVALSRQNLERSLSRIFERAGLLWRRAGAAMHSAAQFSRTLRTAIRGAERSAARMAERAAARAAVRTTARLAMYAAATSASGFIISVVTAPMMMLAAFQLAMNFAAIGYDSRFHEGGRTNGFVGLAQSLDSNINEGFGPLDVPLMSLFDLMTGHPISAKEFFRRWGNSFVDFGKLIAYKAWQRAFKMPGQIITTFAHMFVDHRHRNQMRLYRRLNVTPDGGIDIPGVVTYSMSPEDKKEHALFPPQMFAGGFVHYDLMSKYLMKIKEESAGLYFALVNASGVATNSDGEVEFDADRSSTGIAEMQLTRMSDIYTQEFVLPGLAYRHYLEQFPSFIEVDDDDDNSDPTDPPHTDPGDPENPENPDFVPPDGADTFPEFIERIHVLKYEEFVSKMFGPPAQAETIVWRDYIHNYAVDLNLFEMAPVQSKKHERDDFLIDVSNSSKSKYAKYESLFIGQFT